jgi:DNA-binding XRE family transcriptional regulator
VNTENVDIDVPCILVHTFEVPRKPTSQERDDERLKLGRALVLARTRSALSQTDAATALAVSRVTVSKWERGLSEPEALDLAKLADLYGLTLDALCGRSDLPPA